MFKKINKVVTYFKIIFSLHKAQESFDFVSKHEPLFSDTYNNEDIVCLSMGRWSYFKHLNLPQYTIGLDKDHESLLDQYTYGICDGKDLPIYAYTLDQTRKKIEICTECVETAKTVRQYLVEKEFIKN